MSVTTRQAFQEKIRALAAETIGAKVNDIDTKASLVASQRNFSSFALLELVLRIEDAFGIQIPDDELDPDTFYSIESISDYVGQMLEAKSS